MGEGGHVEPERLVDEDLARGVGQVVVAADDVRDAHVRVVAHHGEVVGGGAVGAHDDHVVHHLGREADVAVHGVVELDGPALGGHAQAPHVRLAGLDAPGRLGRVEVAAGAVVARVAALVRLGCGALGVQLLLRAEAGVHAAALLHLLERRGVGVRALRLEVGSGGSPHLGAFVPIEPQPLHCVEDDLHVLLGGTLGVGVFDAQDEVAAHGARERPVVDGRSCAAHMQAAGGGRCEAHADFLVLVSHGCGDPPDWMISRFKPSKQGFGGECQYRQPGSSRKPRAPHPHQNARPPRSRRIGARFNVGASGLGRVGPESRIPGGGGAARLAPAAKNRVFSHVPDLCAPLLWENAPCRRWCDLSPEKTAGQKLTKSYFFLFGALRGAHKSGTWCFSALFDDASAHNSRTCPRFGFRALRKGCWGEGRRRLPFIALASPIAAPVSGGARCDGLPMRPSPVRTSCPGRWPPAARRVRIRSSFELVPK